MLPGLTTGESNHASDPGIIGIGKWTRRLAGVKWILAAFVIYLGVRWYVLGHMAPVSFSDTPSYVDQYRNGFGEGFFGRLRSWCYPMLFWLCRFHLPWVCVIQRLTAAMAWFALALAVARLFRSMLARQVAFWGTLIVSLALFSVMWDAFLLSESLSNSFLIAMTAIWVWFVSAKPADLRPLGWMAAVSLPFAGTRDSNIPLLLALAVCVGLVLLIRTLRDVPSRPPWRTLWLAWILAGVLLCCALFHAHDLQVSKRNSPGLNAVFTLRIFRLHVLVDGKIQDVVNEDYVNWLAEHYQLPVEAARERMGKTIYQAPPMRPEYWDWLMTKGSRAWLSFMLHHPGWVFELYNSYSLYSITDAGVMYLNAAGENLQAAHLALPSRIQLALQNGLNWLLSISWISTLLTLVAAALGAAWIASLFWARLRGGAATLGVLFWLFTVSTLANFMAIFGDFSEGWRHAISGLMALYAALPVLAAALADLIWQLARPAKVSEAADDEVNGIKRVANSNMKDVPVRKKSRRNP